jgi:hypothetical protein
MGLYPSCTITLTQYTMKYNSWAVYEVHTVRVPAEWYIDRYMSNSLELLLMDGKIVRNM